MEKAVATHSSTLTWKIPWTEELGRLQSMGSRRVRHDLTTSLSFFTFLHWRRKWQCSCLENPRDGGAWWTSICGVTQSQTQLKWLSSSSSLITNISDKYYSPQFTDRYQISGISKGPGYFSRSHTSQQAELRFKSKTYQFQTALS